MQVEEILQEAVRIGKKFGAQSIYLFGSRAKGTATQRSDIDLAVSGVADVFALKECLDELPTLYSIDLVDLDTCRNQELLEDIREYGREIYKKI